MKKAIISIAVIFALIPSFSFCENFSQKHEKVKKLFQSSAEPIAKDAVWTQRDIFKVGVIDDGSSRDGYAQYVCEVLYDEGFKGQSIWVQIIDVVKLNKTGKWVKLGEAKCQ